MEHSVEDRIQQGEPGIYYVLFPREDFDSTWEQNTSVMPLLETVEWAQQYEASFQPALKILDEIHDFGLDLSTTPRKSTATHWFQTVSASAQYCPDSSTASEVVVKIFR